MEGQTDRRMDVHRDGWTDIQTSIGVNGRMGAHSNGWTDRQTDEKVDRWTSIGMNGGDRQTDGRP